MYIKNLLCAALFMISYGSFAQQMNYNKTPEFLKANSRWAFGNYGGLNFNNGGPASMSTSMMSSSGSASVADPETGKLLFYSNGDKIWNANHQLMSNGQDLLNNPTNLLTFQCVSIVPVINMPGRYYVFSLNELYSDGTPIKDGALFYSVVDMNLDNGMGNVVVGQKKVVLTKDTLSKAMIAIPGNCGDVWLMVHSYTSSKFMSYHITKDGVAAVPVISDNSSGLIKYNNAVLAVSPDRQKIAITNTEVNNGGGIGRFNTTTGKVSDVIRIGGGAGFSTGVCFSPDNSKLYLASLFPSGIFQYDISVHNAADITLSTQSVASADSGQFYALKLYNDTIYTYTTNGLRSISRINQPNLAGSACAYQPNAINLIGDTIVLGTSFNNEVVLALPPVTTFVLALDSVVCSADYTLNAPEGFSDYEWEDGSTTPQRTITAPGTYWVASKDLCSPRVDTFIVAGVGFTAPAITANIPELSVPATYKAYQWLLDGVSIAGATTNSYTALKNGDYQVIVSSKDGCVDTSAVQPVTDIDETSIAYPDLGSIQISLYPNPATTSLYISAPVAINVVLSSIEGRTINEFKNVHHIDLQGLSKGVYLLRITDSAGHFIKVEKIIKQ